MRPALRLCTQVHASLCLKREEQRRDSPARAQARIGAQCIEQSPNPMRCFGRPVRFTTGTQTGATTKGAAGARNRVANEQAEWWNRTGANRRAGFDAGGLSCGRAEGMRSDVLICLKWSAMRDATRSTA